MLLFIKTHGAEAQSYRFWLSITLQWEKKRESQSTLTQYRNETENSSLLHTLTAQTRDYVKTWSLVLLNDRSILVVLLLMSYASNRSWTYLLINVNVADTIHLCILKSKDDVDDARTLYKEWVEMEGRTYLSEYDFPAMNVPVIAVLLLESFRSDGRQSYEEKISTE